MAGANEEILRQAFAAWNSGDFDAALEFVADDIRWETTGLFPGLEPVYEGHQGVRRFWTEFSAPWTSIELQPIEIEEPYPDWMIVHVMFQAEGRQGIAVDLEIWQLYGMCDGKLAWFRAHPDRESALATAADAVAGG